MHRTVNLPRTAYRPVYQPRTVRAFGGVNWFPVACATGAAVAIICGATAFPILSKGPAFELRITTASGNVYAVETGLTIRDCVALWGEFPADVSIECAREGAPL